jgi:hypothetical protein
LPDPELTEDNAQHGFGAPIPIGSQPHLFEVPEEVAYSAQRTGRHFFARCVKPDKADSQAAALAFAATRETHFSEFLRKRAA